MKKILSLLAIASMVAAMPSPALARAPLEGQWKNPKGNVVVRVAACGAGLCGTVVDASAKAKAVARKGGTANLVGTRIMKDMMPIGGGVYRGHAFDPKRNIHAPATIKMQGDRVLLIKGCVLSGLICKEQRWTRVG